MTVKVSDFHDLASILSLFRQNQLRLLPVVDHQGQLVGSITTESICQGIAQTTAEIPNKCNQTEERLLLLESVVVNANDAIIITEAKALDEPFGPQIVYVNAAFTSMSGYTADEVLGKTPRILQGEQTSRTQLERIRAALQAGLPMRTELINYHKNGSKYWVEINLVPIRGQEGKITHFVSVQRDVTDRKQTEEALHSSEELFQQLAKNIPQVFFVRDAKQHNLYYVSPAYEKIWGRSADRLYENPQDYDESIHPLDRDRYLQGIENLKLGKSFNEVYRILRPNGEWRWICEKTFPVSNELGEVYRFTGIAEDITERQYAFESLRESEERFRIMADTAPVLIWMSDPGSLCTFFNKHWLEFTGRSLEEELGNGWLENVHPEDVQKCLDIYLSAFSKRQHFLMEYRLRRADGQYRWLLDKGVPRFTPNGSFVGYIGSCLDITERQQAFESLQESATRLMLALEATNTIYWERNLKNDQMMLLSMVGSLGETQEIPYTQALNRIHPDDREKFNRAHQLAIANFGSLEIEHRILIEGQLSECKWFLTRAIVLSDTTGRPSRLIGVSVDITDRVQAEITIAQSERRFRAIFNGTFQCTGLLTPAGIVLEINQTALKFGGLEQQDVMGHPFWEMRWWTISPQTQNKLKEAIAIAARGEFVRYEVDALGIGQTVRTIDFSLKPLTDETDQIVLLIAEGRDITDLKQAQAALQQANQELEVRVAERTIALQKINHQLVSEISDRQMVEAQLRQSQKMLQLIMDTIPHSIFWKDIDSVFLGCNRNFAKMAGFDKLEDIVGKTDYDLLFNQEEAHFYYSCDAEVMKTNTPQYQIITPQQQGDGTQIWLETNKVPLHNTEGQVVGMLGTLENITPRKQAQEALEKSEERFRFLAESIPQKVWITQANGNIEYVNQRTLDFFASNQEQIFRGEWHQWIHADDQPRYMALWQKSIVTGTPLETECRLLRGADKNYLWHLIRALPLRDRQGKILNWFGTNTDIDDRVCAEVALRESERRYHTIATISPVGLFRTDALGNCLYVNERWSEITGLKKHQSAGVGWFAAIHPEDRERVVTEWHQAVAQNLLFRSEYRFQRPDSSVSWVFSQAVAERTDQGEAIAYIGTITDISQQQAALQERQRAETALAERVRLADFRADVDAVLTQNGTLETMMRGCTQALVKHLDAAFARIWTLNKDEKVLELQVSSGIYTHIDGFNSRVPVGQFKIGLIAQFGQTHLINIVQDDSLISNQEWVKQEGIIANACYPLIVEGETLGVIAMFCRQAITESTFKAIETAADAIAIGIKRKQTEEALRASEERFRLLVEGVKDYAIYMLDPEGRVMSWNSGADCMTGYQAAEIIGHNFSCFFLPEAIANSVPNQQLEVAVVNGRCECESAFLRKDGSHFWANCILTALHDETGKLRGFSKVTRDISERKLGEESLLRFHKAIESTSDAIGMADIKGKGIYVNPAFIELFQYTLEELQTAGGTAAIFKLPQEHQKILATIQRGESWRGEVTMQTRCGQIWQIYLRSDAIKDTTDKIVGTVNIYTDITQRKQAEESLRLRDRAIAASRHGIVITDVTIPDKPLIYVNSAFENMTGYTAAEVIGQNCRLLQGADISQPELTYLRAAVQAGKDCTVILRNYRKDGSLFWNELNISPVYDTDGELTHYIGIQTDITERKQAETALLISQQRLQYLLSSSPAVIYTCKSSSNFGVIFVSENVIAMMGYEAREFVEDSSFWFSHIHPEDAPQVLAKLSKVLEVGSYSLEYRLLHQDNTYRWIYDQGKVVRDEIGNPLELVGYWADITNRKQLEQDLRVALDKEKELNELKSRFVSMTSHEFRTPLSTILSSSELLEHYSHKWTQEKQLTHLHRIQTAVKRMTEMLNDVLVIGKVEAGRLEYRPTHFDLVEYCRQLVEEMQMNLSNQNLISFTSEYESVPCRMDEKLLGHILSNLLSNAIKYSPDSSTGKFTLTCQDGRAVFEIQDQGIGIPEEDLPRLFESFHRAGNVGNILGTGLGLAIVKNCVEIHQGQISVMSTLGVGTKFTVNLPLNSQIQSEVNYAKNFSD